MPAIDYEKLVTYLMIIGAGIAAWFKQRPPKVPPGEPTPIPPFKKGDDPLSTINTLISVINDERRERAEDRTRFQKLYQEISDQLNIERSERGTLKIQIENEQTDRRKLENDLNQERTDRQDLDARLTATQNSLTIALADNGRLARDNARLTSDNSDLRKVNADLLAINAELRQRNTQLVETLEGLRSELALSTQLLQSKVDQTEGN